MTKLHCIVRKQLVGLDLEVKNLKNLKNLNPKLVILKNVKILVKEDLANSNNYNDILYINGSF